MTLYRNSDRGVWWATTTFFPQSIIICLNPGPGGADSLGQACTLGWRSRDLETGGLRFGKTCKGEMTFHDGEEGVGVYGVLFGLPVLGDVEFSGERMEGECEEGDFQDEWEGFPAEAYGRR
jgi:hypothetical protein